MAALENNGFAHWAQPANLVFVSVARSVPPRLTHPPPQLLATESACPRASVLDCIEEVCLDAPN